MHVFTTTLNRLAGDGIKIVFDDSFEIGKIQTIFEKETNSTTKNKIKKSKPKLIKKRKVCDFSKTFCKEPFKPDRHFFQNNSGYDSKNEKTHFFLKDREITGLGIICIFLTPYHI